VIAFSGPVKLLTAASPRQRTAKSGMVMSRQTTRSSERAVVRIRIWGVGSIDSVVQSMAVNSEKIVSRYVAWVCADFAQRMAWSLSCRSHLISRLLYYSN